jgi:hydrogenase maturation protease
LIRIIGIGSPFGDDVVGLEVARILAQAPPPNCEVIIADRPGTGLIEMLDNLEAVIVIDAVRSGAAHGTLHHLSFRGLARSTARFTSSHELGLAATVQLAGKLGRAPSQGRVLGIEIASPPARKPCPLSQTSKRAVSRAVVQVRLWARELNTSELQ